MAGESASSEATASGRWSRAGTYPRRVAGRPEVGERAGRRRDHRAGSSSCARLRLCRRHAGETQGSTTGTRPARLKPRRICPRRSRPRSWTRRIEVRGPDRIDELRPVDRVSVCVVSLFLPTNPDHAGELRWPCGLPVRMVCGRRYGADAADKLRGLLAATARGSSVTRSSRAGRGLLPRTRHRPRSRSPLTPDRGLHPQRRAAKPTIADIWPRTSTRSCARLADLPATARAGLEALSAIALHERSSVGWPDVKLDRLFARWSCR